MYAIILRLLRERIQGHRLVSGKFHALLPLLTWIWLGFALVVTAGRMLMAHDMVALLHCALLGFTLTMPALALRAVLYRYRAGTLLDQPDVRLARLGRWRQIDAIECAAFPHYGANGLMIMLLAGLLLNIPVRALEFIAAMPTPKLYAPAWYFSLHGMMLADLALLSTCYAALVGLAIRRVPHFPRLLAGVWLLDLGVQLAIGGVMSMTPHVPVAVQASLATLLSGNVHKVMISMAIWIPYLLMSPRVNLTYRHRVPASAMARYHQVQSKIG
jgi:hypothetical protein